MRTALGSSPVTTFTRKWSPQRGTTATRNNRSGRPRASSTPARIAPSRSPRRPVGSPAGGSPSTTGSVVVAIVGLLRRSGGRVVPLALVPEEGVGGVDLVPGEPPPGRRSGIEELSAAGGRGDPPAGASDRPPHDSAKRRRHSPTDGSAFPTAAHRVVRT